jgi:hypothetical protein
MQLGGADLQALSAGTWELLGLRCRAEKRDTIHNPTLQLISTFQRVTDVLRLFPIFYS